MEWHTNIYLNGNSCLHNTAIIIDSNYLRCQFSIAPEKRDRGVDATDSSARRPSTGVTSSDRVKVVTDSDDDDPEEDEELLAQRLLELEIDEPLEIYPSVDEPDSVRSKVPRHSDMLLAYATVPGMHGER